MRIATPLRLVVLGLFVFACTPKQAATGTGGNPATGGSATGGTATSTGGTIATGGNATGGTTATGGNATGGSATGGTATTGGITNTGGTNPRTGGTSDTGGTNATGGNAGTGGSTVPPCANGVKDGDETGVDCGGACPACGVDYKINPPNQCQNRYFYPNCKSGDASTECGGVCQPRNACENAPSKDSKIQGFACSRYMLFSPAMLQAAKDDGKALGWSTTEPPFHYAVVGHDTNANGIDKGMVGNQPCCECYQLIFDQPHNEGGTQNNQAPAPMPLVVQSFNIGATTDSFDIYMGAGGFGAFNACMDTSAMKSSAGVALYDGYPADGQPGNGGVKFRTYDECKSGNEKITNVAGISSAACQDKIAGLCGQVKSTKSAELASTTRDSCIKSNQVGTLYHQNWAVYAKRVECPENLTRVTGCKLAPEAGLPKVDPKVTTVEQAKAAGFVTGYHTTTMQDCCKPACGWTEKVGGNEGMKKVDPKFTNFYTCDANDKPLTE